MLNVLLPVAILSRQPSKQEIASSDEIDPGPDTPKALAEIASRRGRQSEAVETRG